MAKAPKSYGDKVRAALITKRITHAEAVYCLLGRMVIRGSSLYDLQRWTLHHRRTKPVFVRYLRKEGGA